MFFFFVLEEGGEGGSPRSTAGRGGIHVILGQVGHDDAAECAPLHAGTKTAGPFVAFLNARTHGPATRVLLVCPELEGSPG